MPIKLENVGIAVRDIEATVAFFTDLGLTVVGRDTVSGEWADTAVGLDGNHARIAVLQTPDGHGQLELGDPLEQRADERALTDPGGAGDHKDLSRQGELAAEHRDELGALTRREPADRLRRRDAAELQDLVDLYAPVFRHGEQQVEDLC